MRSDLRSVSSISGRLANRLPEELLAVFFRLGEVLFLRDDAEARDRIRDRNLPNPGVRDRQEVDVDVVQIRVTLGENLAIVPVEPRVNGVLIEYGILHLQFELVAEEGLASAAVDDHLAVNTHLLRSDREEDFRILRSKIDARNLHTVVHGCAEIVRMLKQHQIELAAIHMVGIVAILHAFLFALFESDIYVVIGSKALEIVDVTRILIVGRPDGTKLVRELRGFHLRKEVEILEHASGRWNQRLAYVRARKQLAFEHDALRTSLRQIARHARSGGPSADNRYIKIRH